MKPSIFVFISGTGKTLLSILNRCKKANVKCVFSNNADAPGLQYARERGGISTCVFDKDNPQVLGDLINMIAKVGKPKVIVLAGYMKILPSPFINWCTAHHIQIVNVHPSLLPKYKGLNTHQRVLDAGDAEHGCTIHHVIAELDAGPIIQQSPFNVIDTDTVESLTEAVKIREQLLYPLIIDDMVV